MHPKRILESLGLEARKGLGQNFLVERSVLAKILDAAGIQRGEAVVEVGPGLAVLTDRLVEEADFVIAVELDHRLAEYLREHFAATENICVVEKDILTVPPIELASLAAGALGMVNPDYQVIANLPYYITSAVLRHFLESNCRPRRMVVMVQLEVAERIVAKPPEMSILSVAVQYFGVPKIVARIPPGAFYPPPKISSAVVRIDVHASLPEAVDTSRFFEIVNAGFGQKRKTIVNSLSSGLEIPKAQAEGYLRRSGIMPGRRAETLSVEEWVSLYREMNQI